MNYVTRFNPTANGDLHLGHVYVMLFNEHMAHSTGGRFYVRIEDNQVDTLHSVSGAEMQRISDRQQEAIEWLGIYVDEYKRQSEMDLEMKEFVAHHDWFIPEYRWPYSIPLNPALGAYNPEQGEWFPYAPYLTYCKVIYDELAGVNVVIRGDDLRSEFALYQHYRQQLRLKEIPHYYLPRLYGPNGEIVSKFHTARPVLEYKAGGWEAGQLLRDLGQAVLKEPADGWDIFNVKKDPRLDPEIII
jgi:glutamyl/glutaminyl-tRNA synthetase